MQVLLYNQLNPAKIPNFNKMKTFLEADDFRSADVKKVGSNLYRARLDRSNRLLFSIYRYQDQPYALALECIEQHAYDKSRFLRHNVTIDESKIPVVDIDQVETEPLVYLNSRLPTFNLLNKVLSFDDAQQAVYTLTPPLIVIGSAGSGKTALTLEKMKEAPGEVLYVTRSPYLVHNSRNLYYAFHYENDSQDVNFMSFAEYLASLQVPEGREISFRDFAGWFTRHRAASKLKDPHQLFEEFQGVIAGSATHAAYLSREDYLDLGIKQSIFFESEREHVYDLFLKYLEFMRENGYYDANVLSSHYLSLVEPRYDFVVVDEVQDLTTIQLQLILKSLSEPRQFILCGDSNQIVHPNFFSWPKLKSFFYKQDTTNAPPAELIRILNHNYRNSVEVTEVANRLLKLKNARFGSIDRESNYLVHSNADKSGAVVLLTDAAPVIRELNQKTYQSTRYAVVVMHPDQKAAAKAHFQTPLIFSIQEAKGLEYDNIILYNFTSGDEERFREITRDVHPEDLTNAELSYARARDKSDKSLEIYKFHINALYVAITRAVNNIYQVESNPSQRLFDLLGLKPWDGPLNLDEQGSSLEEWGQEARKLELQGKQEQADEIRSQILKLKTVPWEVLKGETLSALEHKAFEQDNKKAKLLLFEYALVYQDLNRTNALAEAGFRPAKQPEKGIKLLNQKYFLPYELKKPDAMLREVNQYGVDFRNPFNQTPLMIAARLGNEEQVNQLVDMGADTGLVNNAGFNAFQIVLEQACISPHYAAKKLAGVYEKLESDEMVIQVDGRLVKLDNRLMEFLMLNLMIGMFYTCLGENVVRSHGGAFSSGDFVDVLQHFPEAVVPERRKKRAYISSILSKNEVERDDKYNRKLFRRIKLGHYIINPQLGVWVEGEWRPIYDLLSLDALGYRRRDMSDGYWYDPNPYMQRNLQRFKTLVAQIQSH